MYKYKYISYMQLRWMRQSPSIYLLYIRLAHLLRQLTSYRHMYVCTVLGRESKEWFISVHYDRGFSNIYMYVYIYIFFGTYIIVSVRGVINVYSNKSQNLNKFYKLWGIRVAGIILVGKGPKAYLISCWLNRPLCPTHSIFFGRVLYVQYSTYGPSPVRPIKLFSE